MEQYNVVCDVYQHPVDPSKLVVLCEVQGLFSSLKMTLIDFAQVEAFAVDVKVNEVDASGSYHVVIVLNLEAKAPMTTQHILVEGRVSQKDVDTDLKVFEQSLHVKISEELGLALRRYFGVSQSVHNGHTMSSPTSPARRSAYREQEMEQVPTSLSVVDTTASVSMSVYRKKMIAVIVLVPVVAWLALWGIGRMMQPSDPVADAVNHALTANPAAANAQVELTKNTLKSMGYDLSKVSDVGCLTK